MNTLTLMCYNIIINYCLQEKGREVEKVTWSPTDLSVEVTIGGKENQEFVIKKAALVPINLRVKDQESYYANVIIDHLVKFRKS